MGKCDVCPGGYSLINWAILNGKTIADIQIDVVVKPRGYFYPSAIITS